MIELPHIFREAVRITRHLGFQYLWIDSLCIIQDSSLDWETEASMMSTVYSDAICNIAFLFPPGEESPRHRDDPRTITPCIVRRATSEVCGSYIVPIRYSLVDDEPVYDDWFLATTWPWSTRAWTFQEHILSPRTIFYGHQNIMWECTETFCDELLGIWVPNMIIKLRSYREKTLRQRFLSGSHRPSSSSSPISAYLEPWQDLIHDYRSRELTNPSDRNIAFAGVAEAFQREHRLTYLAGSWAESLPFDILWYTRHNRFWIDIKMNARTSYTEAPIQESVAAIVPSWSWFSQPIFWPGIDVSYGVSAVPSKEYLVCMAKLRHFHWPGRILNQIPPTSFHDFAGLSITLELATYKICCGHSRSPITVDQPNSHRADFHAQLVCFLGKASEVCDHGVRSSRKPAVSIDFLLDSLEVTEYLPETVHFAVIVEKVASFLADTSSGHSIIVEESCRLHGLELAPGEQEGTWKRIGYWEAHLSRPSYELNDEELASLEPYCAKDRKVDRNKVRPDLDPPSTQAKQEWLRAWSKKKGSRVLQMEGVKMETLTLV